MQFIEYPADSLTKEKKSKTKIPSHLSFWKKLLKIF